MLRILRPVIRTSRPYTFVCYRRAFSAVPILNRPTREEYVERGETHQRGLGEISKGVPNAANMADVKMTRSQTSYDEVEAYNNEKRNAMSCTEHWEDSVHCKDGQELYRQFKVQDRKDEEAALAEQSSALADPSSARSDDQEQPPKKRGLGANQRGSNKKAKNGGTAGQPRGIAGDKTRVPSQGQKVQWDSGSGWVDGELVEVLYKEKTVEGETFKGSNEDPLVVLKSSSSGKIAVHNPADVYFD